MWYDAKYGCNKFAITEGLVFNCNNKSIFVNFAAYNFWMKFLLLENNFTLIK